MKLVLTRPQAPSPHLWFFNIIGGSLKTFRLGPQDLGIDQAAMAFGILHHQALA